MTVIEPEQVVGRELLVLAAAIVHNLNPPRDAKVFRSA
jgi:hypothetical protein